MVAQFSLRPATEEDLPLLFRIEQAVHRCPWTEDSFRNELLKPYSAVLVFTDDETDQVIAGYIVYWLVFEECQILNLAVDLPFRGLGFAKQMVRRVIILTEKKGIKKITLDVRKANLPAIQLYQNLRFAIVHVRKRFYSDGEDAFQMVLQLDDKNLEF